VRTGVETARSYWGEKFGLRREVVKYGGLVKTVYWPEKFGSARRLVGGIKARLPGKKPGISGGGKGVVQKEGAEASFLENHSGKKRRPAQLAV